MSDLSHLPELTEEVSREIAAEVAESRRRHENVMPLRTWRQCPVCGAGFSLAGDCRPRITDTCGNHRCAYALERFFQDHPELSTEDAVIALRDAQ